MKEGGFRRKRRGIPLLLIARVPKCVWMLLGNGWGGRLRDPPLGGGFCIQDTFLPKLLECISPSPSYNEKKTMDRPLC